MAQWLKIKLPFFLVVVVGWVGSFVNLELELRSFVN